MDCYLDHNATTPVDGRVDDAMRPWISARFGSASSRDHRFGWDAAEGTEDARTAVAAMAGVVPNRVVFVSGATEALSMGLRGYVGFDGWARKTIVTCATEHSAVLAAARHLCSRTGVRLEVLSVNRVGGIDPDMLRTRLEQVAPGALVALMAANNEIGTVHNVRRIADMAHAMGATFLCDTTQAFGKCAVNVRDAAIDVATISAHKIYGPKGVGALLTDTKAFEAMFDPLILGGGQERGLRGGTLNVPGIVGMGEACRLVTECLDEDMPRMRALRDRLEDGVLSQLSDLWINGDRDNRLCNTSNVGFKGVDARALIRDMHDIAVSTRSACSSGDSGPSHVLKAIGLSDEDAYSCIRFSLGRFTTQDEIDYAIGKVVASAHKLRRAKSVRR